MKKRIIALFLALTLVVTGTVTVFASDIQGETVTTVADEQVIAEEDSSEEIIEEVVEEIDEIYEEASEISEETSEVSEQAASEKTESEDKASEAAEEEVVVSGAVESLVKFSIKMIKEAATMIIDAIKWSTDSSEAITLSGVYYFDEDVDLPPIIVGDGGLTMIIADGVTVNIDASDIDGNYPGIRVEDPDSPLVITGGIINKEGDTSEPLGTGKLIVRGANQCAGIGGRNLYAGGYTTIESCTVEAYGGDYGAGIGGGSSCRGECITINGGNVKAIGGDSAAGIGSGAGGFGEAYNIMINGGTVYAEGGCDEKGYYGGAGIGGGQDNGANGITINQNVIKSDGTYVKTYVTAVGKNGAAGIGSGSHEANDHQGHDIKITGGEVWAYGSVRPTNENKGGAGIGSGYYHKAYNITITGGDIHAFGYGGAAGIGGGSKAAYATHDIEIQGGTIEAVSVGNSGSNGNGAGIGSGAESNVRDITISGGTINAKSDNEGAGIGAGSGGNLKDNDEGFGIKITGGDITAESADGGAGIGAGYKGDAKSISISGADTVVRATANNGAGIGGGSGGGTAKDISIDDGYIEATSKGLGAGIGSGKSGKTAENIRINGGIVKATGGGSTDTWGGGSGCGIGVGYYDTSKTEPNDEIYISTSLVAQYWVSASSEWRELKNNGGDLAHNADADFMKKRKVQITNGSERSITIGAQSGSVEYGTSTESVYTYETSYIGNADYAVTWYSDAEKTTQVEAPAGIDVEINDGNIPKTITITNGMKTPAGTYYFTLSASGVESNVATYKIAKRPASITSGSAIKIYDGTPLTCETYEVSGFIDGEGVNVKITGSCTGSADQSAPTVAENTFDEPTAKAGTDLNNYDITKKYGTLTVIKQLFVITAGNYSGVYDGEEHSFNDETNGTKIKVTGKNGIDFTSAATFKYKTSTDYNPDTKEGTWDADWSDTLPSRKDAGKTYIKIQATATVNGQQGTIESNDIYKMEVTKRNVTLTSESETKEYDGTALTNGTVTVDGDGFVGNDGFIDGKLKTKETATVTKVGSVTNEIDVALDKDGKIKDASILKSGTSPDNYKFTKVEGTLTVVPYSTPIVITTKSDTKLYNGEVINAGEASSNFDKVKKATGDTLDVTLNYKGKDAVKDAGTYSNSIASYKVTDQYDQDVTDCYTFGEPSIGELIIEKRQVTLTSGSDLKVWTKDGDYAYNDDVVVSGDGLVSGETLAYSGFQKVTEISYTPTENTFKYAAAEGSAFDKHNYDITVENGYLMLVEEMSIVGVDQTFTYDGTEHEAPVTVIDNGQGDEVKREYSTSTDNKTWTEYTTTIPSLKNAGTLYVKAKATKGIQEKEASYKVEVKKRTVVITSASKNTFYTGAKLTCENSTISGKEFVGDEGVEISYTGAQTDVGSSDNTFTYEFKSNTDANNYAIQTVYGTLTVTKAVEPIVIFTGSKKWAYNGSAMSYTEECSATWRGETKQNGEKLYGDDVLQIMPNGTITDVGTVENTCSYKVVRNGVDVTGNYTFDEPVYGTLEVTPRSIVITTASAEKVYDGTALTANKDTDTEKDYTVTGDGFIEGQGFKAVNIAGTRKNAGTVANALNETTPYTFKDGTDPKNYEVTVITGTLTVNKRKVTVTSGSAVSTYGACPEAGLSNKADCTVGGDGFVTGEASPKGAGVLAKPTSEPTTGEPAKAENTIDYAWAGNGNPANYEITECLGTLMITNNGATKAVATDYVGVYDGEAHSGSFVSTLTDPIIQYSEDNSNWVTTPIKYTDATVDTEGKTVSKTVYVKVTNKDDSTIYATCQYEVTITPRELTLTAGSAEKVYDGTALTCDKYIVGGDGFVKDEEKDANVSTTGTIKNVGTVKNEISYEKTKKGTFDPNNYTINNYKGDVNPYDGTLTVTKRQVKLMSVGFAREYEEVPESIIITSGEFKGTYSTAPVVYDGQEHGCEAVIEVGAGQVQGIAKIPGMGFVDGEGVTYSGFTKIKDAGLYKNKFEYAAKEGTNPSNYDIECIYGLMRILPCEVTVTSASASKLYDGTPLTKTKDAITVTTSLEGNKMPKGEEVKCDVYGSQTEVGKSANTFDVEITNSKAINYEINKVEGTLEVYSNDTLRLVVPENKEYTYDGKAHGDAALAYIGDTLLDDATIWYSVDGGKTYVDEAIQLTDVGTASVMAYVEKYGYTTADGKYTITVVPSGELSVAAPEKLEWVYDGKAHGDAAIAYLGKEVAKDAKIVYSTDGGKTWSENVAQITNVGTLEVTAKATHANYKEATVTYKLTVTKATDTGDHNNMTLWIILTVAAAAALFGACFLRRRKFF